MLSLAGCSFDESEWPILRITLERKLNDEEFRAYLDQYRTYVEGQRDYGLIFDVSVGFGFMPMSQVRMQLDFLSDNAELIRKRVRGIAFVLPSPAHRGLLKAMLKMGSLPTDFTVVGTVEDARRWLQG